jgi:hypothetical protein
LNLVHHASLLGEVVYQQSNSTVDVELISAGGDKCVKEMFILLSNSNVKILMEQDFNLERLKNF